MKPLHVAGAAIAALVAGSLATEAADIAKGRKKLGEIVLGKEYKVMAPEFFRNVWVNQIVINNIEIHPYGAPHALEFDVAGTVEFDFVPIRTGTYDWYIAGLQEQGMTGTLIVE